MLALLIALGCTGKDSVDVDSGSATDDSSEPQQDDVSPRLSDALAYCYEHTTGDTFYQWSLTVVYDDPQGLDNVPSSFHMVEVYKSDNLVTDIELLACDTNSGNCLGSFKADAYDVLCPGAADDYEFKIIVTDYDGNEGSATVAGYEAVNSQGDPKE